jgi:hypothetical protein
LQHKGTEDTVKKRELRIISKIGLLFVVIGFFLPMSCNLNGFQIAKTFETFGGPNILSISLYSIFIFSCIGLMLLAALLMKRKFSIGYDWADLIIIIAAFSVFMYGQLQSSDDPLLALFSRLQSGAYIIFIGLAGALFFLIAATGKTGKTKNKVYEGEKVLDEDTIKKIAIREKLFKKLRKMNIIGELFFPFIYFLLIFMIYKLEKIIMSDWAFDYHLGVTILLIIISFLVLFIIMIIVFMITGYLTRLIFFIIHEKKMFIYWHNMFELHFSPDDFFNKRKNKKKHSDLSSLWDYWKDYYRKGKYRRGQCEEPDTENSLKESNQ